jgi:class 3 adenylate cyclase
VPAAIAVSTGATSPSSTREPEGERKQLTVLFADVQGSMELQEDLDVEAWAKIVDRFVKILGDGVRRFGGTVDKFTGDGIMALFGAPLAQEDHARRACHAAWSWAACVRTVPSFGKRSDFTPLLAPPGTRNVSRQNWPGWQRLPPCRPAVRRDPS